MADPLSQQLDELVKTFRRHEATGMALTTQAVSAFRHLLESAAEQAGALEAAAAPAAPRPNPKMAWVIAAVADHTGVQKEFIRGDTREAHVVLARHMAAFLGVRLTGSGLSAAGRALRRDHTSIRHAVRSIEAKRQSDPQMQAALDAIAARVRALATSEHLAEPVYVVAAPRPANLVALRPAASDAPELRDAVAEVVAANRRVQDAFYSNSRLTEARRLFNRALRDLDRAFAPPRGARQHDRMEEPLHV